MIKKFFILICFAFLTCIQGVCFEALNFNGFIADTANILSYENETALNQILLELQTKTKADVAIVTLNSLNGEPVEDVSIEIARKYKLGDKKLNNGALILVAPNDRKARIEIGYGLEGILNDSKTGRILDDYMIPFFKEGNYEAGIIQGTLALAYEIADAYGVRLSFERPETDNDIDILFVIIFIIILMMINSRGGPGGLIFFGMPRGFGGGGGIRFGGGGGFGGGGASRGW